MKVVMFCVQIVLTIFAFLFKIIYTVLMKLRLMGVFLWFIGLGIMYWDDAMIAKTRPYIIHYTVLGVFVLIGTIIAMITAVVRYWKPGFKFLDLFTGAPEHMDIRYFQAVTSLEELNSQYLHSTLQAEMQGDKRTLHKMEREYEYLKRKFDLKAE